MWVKPNPNKKVNEVYLKVYDPVHRDFLPEDGRDVPGNTYWIRRLQEKDIIRSEKTFKKIAEQPKKQKKAGTNTPKGNKKTKITTTQDGEINTKEME